MSEMHVSRLTAGRQVRKQTTTAARRNKRAWNVDTQVQVQTVPEEVMREARKLVGGRDVRLKVQSDGTVMIVNGGTIK